MCDTPAPSFISCSIIYVWNKITLYLQVGCGGEPPNSRFVGFIANRSKISKVNSPLSLLHTMTMKLTFEKFIANGYKFSQVNVLLNLLYTMTIKLIFEKFHRQHVQTLQGQLATRDCKEGWEANQSCSQTWSFGFQFRLGKHFSDECGLPFYCLKIGFLEYLRISGEIRYRNGPIGYWKKVTIWKEGCIVHVRAVIHDYQGEVASRSKKCLWWKDCPGDLSSLNTDNVNFCTRSRPYQREAPGPSGPGRVFFTSF